MRRPGGSVELRHAIFEERFKLRIGRRLGVEILDGQRVKTVGKAVMRIDIARCLNKCLHGGWRETLCFKAPGLDRVYDSGCGYNQGGARRCYESTARHAAGGLRILHFRYSHFTAARSLIAAMLLQHLDFIAIGIVDEKELREQSPVALEFFHWFRIEAQRLEVGVLFRDVID